MDALNEILEYFAETSSDAGSDRTTPGLAKVCDSVNFNWMNWEVEEEEEEEEDEEEEEEEDLLFRLDTIIFPSDVNAAMIPLDLMNDVAGTEKLN